MWFAGSRSAIRAHVPAHNTQLARHRTLPRRVWRGRTLKRYSRNLGAVTTDWATRG